MNVGKEDRAHPGRFLRGAPGLRYGRKQSRADAQQRGLDSVATKSGIGGFQLRPFAVIALRAPSLPRDCYRKMIFTSPRPSAFFDCEHAANKKQATARSPA